MKGVIHIVRHAKFGNNAPEIINPRPHFNHFDSQFREHRCMIGVLFFLLPNHDIFGTILFLFHNPPIFILLRGCVDGPPSELESR